MSEILVWYVIGGAMLAAVILLGWGIFKTAGENRRIRQRRRRDKQAEVRRDEGDGR
jgi:hypothetical protein